MGATNAWASADVSFSAIERITDNGDGSWKTAGNAGNKYSLAIADLSGVSGIADAAKVSLEFDTQINSGGRWYIGIGDKSVRGTTAGTSSKTVYDTDGVIIRFGTGNGSTFTINDEGNYTAFGVRLHATFNLDRTTGKYSFTLHDTTNDTQIYTTSGVSTSVSNATIVEAYSWNNNDETLKYLSDVTVTTTATYSYTVNVKISEPSTILKTITGKVVAGEQVKIPYQKYINYKGTLYTKAAISNQYRYDFTPEADNETKEIEYTATDITNVLYYAEGEDITGVTNQNNGGCYSRTSGCSTGVASNTSFVTLPAGTYKITVGFYNANSGTHTVTITDGTNTLYTHGFPQNWQTYTSEENIVLDDTKTLYATGGDTRASYPKGIDYIYITGDFAEGNNIDVTGLIVNADMETSAGGSEYWQEGVKGWNNCSVVTNYRHLEFNSTQNPNGVFTGTYAFENYTDETGGLAGQMSQTINGLPNGVYKFQLAVLAENVSGQFVYAKSNGKTYSTPIAGAGSVANDYEVIAVVEDNQLEIGLDMNGANNRWAAIDNARLTYAPTVSTTFDTNGYATFASPYALDLTTDAQSTAGVTAYKSAISGTTVNFTPLDQTVPANTGILLKGTANATANIPVAASGSEVSENAFLVNTSGAVFEAEANTTYYAMKKDSNPLTFGTFDPSSLSFPATKAYLKVANGAVGAKALTAIFGDDVTGISQVEKAEAKGGNAIYNLAGQRVSQPTKGLYIVNGKKVVVK